MLYQIYLEWFAKNKIFKKLNNNNTTIYFNEERMKFMLLKLIYQRIKTIHNQWSNFQNYLQKLYRINIKKPKHQTSHKKKINFRVSKNIKNLYPFNIAQLDTRNQKQAEEINK